MAGTEVLDALNPHMQAEATGTAMIVFADNSLGRIYMNTGTPTTARYRGFEGIEALVAWQGIGVQTVKFHANTDIVKSRVLLDSNYEVIDTLSRESAAPVARHPPPGAVPQQDPPITGPLLNPAQRRRLGALLTDFIGPVAPLVMSDLPAAVDIETALSIVSREIDDTQRASEFVNTARQLLG